MGIGLSGIETSEKPTQAELFDFGNSKKAKLEKTLFEMERKNPSLNVRKARLLSTEAEQNNLFRRDLND